MPVAVNWMFRPATILGSAGVTAMDIREASPTSSQLPLLPQPATKAVSRKSINKTCIFFEYSNIFFICFFLPCCMLAYFYYTVVLGKLFVNFLIVPPSSGKFFVFPD